MTLRQIKLFLMMDLFVFYILYRFLFKFNHFLINFKGSFYIILILLFLILIFNLKKSLLKIYYFIFFYI